MDVGEKTQRPTRFRCRRKALEVREQRRDVRRDVERRAVGPGDAIAGLEPAQAERGEALRAEHAAQHVRHDDQRRTEVEREAVGRREALRAPARDRLGFEHGDAHTGARQLESGRKSRETGTDDESGIHAHVTNSRPCRG